MTNETNRRQKVFFYGLLLISVLAIGFLIYIVISQLSANDSILPPATESSAETPDPASVSSTNTAVGIRIGQQAPDFQLPSLENEEVALSDFLGKVVILDFWASWCTPCRLTMPGLETIARSLAADVVLVGVNLDQTQSAATSYLASNNYDTMITLRGSYSAANAVFNTYGGGGIPKTYVIDRDGIIRYVGHPGSLSRLTVERLL